MDLLAWLHKQLAEAKPDLLRESGAHVRRGADSAEADALCGAAFGERSAGRVNRRNGYRPRPFDTRTGTISLQVPKLRSGSYFPGWLLERRRHAERDLAGVELVVSDDHRGLTKAIDALLTGAAWQRCHTHFILNLLARVPKSARPFVATLVRTIFAQPSVEEVAAQLARVTEQLRARFPQVAEMLTDAAPDVTAFAAFPTEHWRQIWSNNPQERINREIRRRADVVGIFLCGLLMGARVLVGAPIATPSSGWSAWCSPSNTMSGPSGAAP